MPVRLEESKFIISPTEMVPEESFREFPGFDEWDYSDILDAGELTPYALRKIIKWKDGKTEAFFHKVLEWEHDEYDKYSPSFDEHYICFKKNEIQNIIKKYPELLNSKVIHTMKDYDYDFQECFDIEENDDKNTEEELVKKQDKNMGLRTQAAIQVRKEKTLEDWKKAFKVMLKIFLQCQEEGPRPRTTPELEKMCARYNGSLDKSKMTFLRECLLECLGTEYVNTTGGPTIQG